MHLDIDSLSSRSRNNDERSLGVSTPRQEIQENVFLRLTRNTRECISTLKMTGKSVSPNPQAIFVLVLQ